MSDFSAICVARTPRGRATAWLRQGSALAAAAIALASPASPAAAADECGAASDGAVTCTAAGNPYTGGITYVTGRALTLNTTSDVRSIGPISLSGTPGALTIVNAGSVTSTVPNRAAVQAIGDDSVTVRGAGAISTSGAGSQGVRAVAGFTTGDATIDVGAVSVTGGGAGLFAFSQKGVATARGTAISATDDQGSGVVAQGSFGANVGFTSISTGGALAPGVLAEAPFGNVVVSGGSVQTTGAASGGVIARTTGDATVTATGPVNTAGAGSIGISALTTGGAAVINAADVNTSGDASAGLYANGVSATINSTGTVATTGSAVAGEATAIHAIATKGAARIRAGSLGTVADGASGALAQSDGGNAFITLSGTARTAGAGAHALDAEDLLGTASITNNGVIFTTGLGAQGIRSIGGTGATVAGTGSVSTTGDAANGVFAASFTGPVVVGTGAVTTSGNSSAGILAGTAADVTVTAAGRVTTSGALSQGIYAISTNGAARIFSGDVATRGDGSTGLLAQGTSASITSSGTVSTTGAAAGGDVGAAHAIAGAGPASVTVRNASTTADNAPAAFAESNGGGATVTLSGNAATTGAGSHALWAQDFLGSATVANNGSVTTSGAGAQGIRAVGNIGATVSGTGSTSTTGDNAAGVFAASIFSPTTVTTGAVRTTGIGSTGIVAGASRSTVGVTATSVQTSGKDAEGIIIVSAAGATVNVGSVTTTGDRSTGVDVASNVGPITITSGTVATRGANSPGIVAVGFGPIRATTGSTSAASGSAIFLQSNASTADLTVTAATSSGSSDTVSVNAAGAATLTIAAGGSVAGGINSAVISGATTTTNNAGVLRGGTGYALAAFGGAATLNNSGALTGRILFTGGDDNVNNSGTFTATGNSDFGAGRDLFTNSGTFRAAPPTAPATITLIGLERFANSGTVTLVNGTVGDRLMLPGSYSGTGGAVLALDATFTPAAITADQLVVGGAATGATLVSLAPTGTSNFELIVPTGPVLVQGGAGSVAGAFTLVPTQSGFGFAQYAIVFNSATNAYTLVAAPSAAARREAKYVEAARNIWYRTSDGWTAHMQQLRDVQATGDSVGSRLWGQASGTAMLRRSQQDYSFAGSTVAAGQSYGQDQFGVQLGYDLARLGGGGGVAFGVTGGYSSSDMKFRSSGGRGHFDTVNGGAYLSLARGPLFASVLGQYDYHWLRISDATLLLSRKVRGQSYGATGEVGLRFGSGGFFFEPSATLAYVRTDLDSFDAFSSNFDFRLGTGLRGTAGARVGTSLDRTDGSHVLVYAGARAVKEFKGHDSVTFTNNGAAYAFGSDNIGLYGEGTAGVKVISTGGVSGFIEGVGDYGRRQDGLRGGGARVGLNVAL